MKKYLFVLAAVSGLILFSCKKDKDDNGASKTQLVASATWKYDTAMLDKDKNGTPDDALPAGLIGTCTTDNTITFKSDSTGVLDEGATKCTSSAAQSTAFTWYFKENESVLYSPDPIFGGYSGEAKIQSITDTKMVLIKEFTYGIVTVNVILTLKH